MTEREALYAAICAEPEDITLRLAYADWLDEQPTTKTCPKCAGKGYYYDPPYYAFGPDECGTCRGTGAVPSADAALAEFIRAQCALECAPAYRHVRPDLDWTDPGFSDQCRTSARLRRRETDLLAANPEWSHCPCPACVCVLTHESRGWNADWRRRRPVVTCQTCGGTGDLFRHRHTDSPLEGEEPYDRTVTFRNGFPDSVTCTVRELGGEQRVVETCGRCDGSKAVDSHTGMYRLGTRECPRCRGRGTVFAARFVPSPWAKAVVTRTPVTRFVLDLHLFHRNAATTGPLAGEVVWDWSSAHVPTDLMDEMKTDHPDRATGTDSMLWWMEFPTEQESRDAIARAGGRLVRRNTYGDG